MELIHNWYIIFALCAVLIFAAVKVMGFFKLPTDQQKKNVQEFLKWVVVECEKQLGGGTGQLKLRKAYAMTVEKFPWVATVVSFEDFSAWVDVALEWMHAQLSQNQNLQGYVEK